MNLRWFNISAPYWLIGPVRLRLWNLFNRRAQDGHYWGLGLLQINGRHLLYIGHSGVGLFFLGMPAQFMSWHEQVWFSMGRFRLHTWLTALLLLAIATSACAIHPVVPIDQFEATVTARAQLAELNATSTPVLPAAMIEPDVAPVATLDCAIKVNRSVNGELIYHLPGQATYKTSQRLILTKMSSTPVLKVKRRRWGRESPFAKYVANSAGVMIPADE